MKVSFNGVLMTEQSNAYHQKAYLETLQNYKRQEGEATLGAEGWVNELNVRDSLTPPMLLMMMNPIQMTGMEKQGSKR